MGTETIDPKPNCFPADNHATFGKQILDISRAQREPMVSPDRVGDDLTRATIALQAQHCRRHFHAPPCSQVSMAEHMAISGVFVIHQSINELPCLAGNQYVASVWHAI